MGFFGSSLCFKSSDLLSASGSSWEEGALCFHFIRGAESFVSGRFHKWKGVLILKKGNMMTLNLNAMHSLPSTAVCQADFAASELRIVNLVVHFLPKQRSFS